MSNIIVWKIENTSQDNQNNLEEISQWWTRLNGKRIKLFTFSGSYDGGNFQTHELVLIRNPSLKNSTLSFNNSYIEIKKLTLNLQTERLEVETPDSPTILAFQAI